MIVVQMAFPDSEVVCTGCVQWATKVMTPASMYFLWKQGSCLVALCTLVHVFLMEARVMPCGPLYTKRT